MGQQARSNPTSFKAQSNKLGVWLNNYNGRYLCHLRQDSADPQKPKQNYIFMDAALVCELLFCCARADQPDFAQEILHKQESKGGTYLLELVKRSDNNNNTIFYLQSRKSENTKPSSWIEISDFEEFKQVLLEANVSYRVMFYEDKCRAEQAKKQVLEELEYGMKKLKISPEEPSAEHSPKSPQKHEAVVEECTLIY